MASIFGPLTISNMNSGARTQGTQAFPHGNIAKQMRHCPLTNDSVPMGGFLVRAIPLAALLILASAVPSYGRTSLTADRTYYVRTDGNDACDGLTNTGGSSGACAFLTVQKAIDTYYNTIDGAGYACNIQVGNGTYSSFSVTRFGNPVGCIPELIGDTTTPSNVILTVTSPSVALFDLRRGAQLYVKGFKVQSLTSGLCFHVSGALLVITGNMDFGTCVDGQLAAEHGGLISITAASYTVSGGGAFHWRAIASAHIATGSSAVTLSGAPNFTTAFGVAQMNGMLQINASFSGSATGPRYLAQDGDLEAGTTLPGNSEGSVIGAGDYNSDTRYSRRLVKVTVDFNSANTDNAVPITIPTGYSRYVIAGVRISGASASLSGATFGVFTAVGAGGTAIVASGTSATVTTSSENTLNNLQTPGLAISTAQSLTYTTLYFRVQTAKGSAATAIVAIEYVLIS
jgi:hypothetical protein